MRPHGAVPAGPMVLSIVALVVLAVSGYLGGKLAYRYGVRVAGETTQAGASTKPPPPAKPRASARTVGWW